MKETKAEEIIGILYAIFGFMIFSDGYEKSGYAFMAYAVINLIYAFWLAIRSATVTQTRGEMRCAPAFYL